MPRRLISVIRQEQESSGARNAGDMDEFYDPAGMALRARPI